MKIKDQIVLSQNITLVYRSLDLQKIDVNHLRDLLDLRAQQMIVNPNQIIITHPSKPTTIQIGNRRAQVGFQQRSKSIGNAPLWNLAHECHHLLSEPILIAFGFNYDTEIMLGEGNIHETITTLFPPAEKKVETALGGTLSLFSLTPRFVFQRDQTHYELVLQPMDKQRIRALFNVHFESEEISLPSQSQLEAAFRQEYQRLSTIVSGLE